MTSGEVFEDRSAAGSRLAERVGPVDRANTVVLGLARGGVPVAAELAARLDLPLDVAVARKIGAPGRPELGVGAVTADGPPIYDDHGLTMLGLTAEDMADTCARERAEARRRLARYHTGRGPLPIAGRNVLLVDDGLATGVTARAAVRDLRRARPQRIVFAAPVCAPDAARSLEREADEVVCLTAPPDFRAVGSWYRDFAQTPDREVVRLLTEARQRCSSTGAVDSRSRR